MKELECRGCTACCEWADDEAIRPLLTCDEAAKLRHTIIKGQPRLESNEDGSCVYLEANGCSIHKHRPMQCKMFDCRVLYEQMKGKTFVNCIIIGGMKEK